MPHIIFSLIYKFTYTKEKTFYELIMEAKEQLLYQSIGQIPTLFPSKE